MSITNQDLATLEKRVGHQGNSPLFAQLASYYLEQSRAEEALRLCDAGLANFPFYTTGHLIKGKTLLALKMYAEARREFEFVSEFLPINNAVKELLAKVPAKEEILSAPVQEPPPPLAEPAREIEIPSAAEQPAAATRTVGLPATEIGQPVQDFGFVQPAPEPGQSLFMPPEPAATHANPVETFPSPAVDTAPVIPEPAPASFTDFSFIPPAASLTPEPQNFAQEQVNNLDFPFSQQQEKSSSLEQQDESFQKFVMRKSAELSGENTTTMEEYFASQAQVSFSPIPEKIFDNTPPENVVSVEPNKIEELAEKLQGAGKITPVINFAQKETPTVSEDDAPASVGFVTPTLAEIYAKQGWYDDAIKAYKTLARNKPSDRERFEQRVAELEALKQQAEPQ
ncbi:MAG TPA: hypothetical protein VMU30_00865 [Bacteroidota bacterium]|nr:hypothetical protein [Bacteroidota bacterium]